VRPTDTPDQRGAEGTVKEVEAKVSRSSEVIFPVAVGAVFLVVLVVGAIVG